MRCARPQERGSSWGHSLQHKAALGQLLPLNPLFSKLEKKSRLDT